MEKEPGKAGSRGKTIVKQSKNKGKRSRGDGIARGGGVRTRERPDRLPAMVQESRPGREKGQKEPERKPLQSKAKTTGKLVVTTTTRATV